LEDIVFNTVAGVDGPRVSRLPLLQPHAIVAPYKNLIIFFSVISGCLSFLTIKNLTDCNRKRSDTIALRFSVIFLLPPEQL
jgi:hypothetical protein